MGLIRRARPITQPHPKPKKPTPRRLHTSPFLSSPTHLVPSLPPTRAPHHRHHGERPRAADPKAASPHLPNPSASGAARRGNGGGAPLTVAMARISRLRALSPVSRARARSAPAWREVITIQLRFDDQDAMLDDTLTSVLSPELLPRRVIRMLVIMLKLLVQVVGHGGGGLNLGAAGDRHC
uniref:Uncharacterized protein n=1 Tax=Oryza meridionalis TaxID=40149 RepID=A0A0E0CGQ3_9ORYZ